MASRDQNSYWEYRSVLDPSDSKLNDLGMDRWEAYAVRTRREGGVIIYLKRRK